MGILQIIAEQQLGSKTLKANPEIIPALEAAEQNARQTSFSPVEKERVAALIDLCFEYDREQDKVEKANILRTLAEISAQVPPEWPGESMETWEKTMKAESTGYASADRKNKKMIDLFLKKYFTLRAQAKLSTQAEVAKASGLSRSYVAIIETGEHFPQQKTLQKLAHAFGVSVSDLLP